MAKKSLSQIVMDRKERLFQAGLDNLLIDAMECKSGLIFSLQASRLHYCLPRYNVGPWTHLEVGYPNQIVEELLPYAEDPKDPLDTVYPYVPGEVLESIIKANGGLKRAKPIKKTKLPRRGSVVAEARNALVDGVNQILGKIKSETH